MHATRDLFVAARPLLSALGRGERTLVQGALQARSVPSSRRSYRAIAATPGWYRELAAYSQHPSPSGAIATLVGIVAGAIADTNRAELSEGITILTASGADQYATEHSGAGLFTTLLVDALGGAAGNLVGQVTPGAVYAHIDQSLGAWEQRPVFKTNVKRFVSMRQVAPPIELAELRRLPRAVSGPWV